MTRWTAFLVPAVVACLAAPALATTPPSKLGHPVAPVANPKPETPASKLTPKPPVALPAKKPSAKSGSSKSGSAKSGANKSKSGKPAMTMAIFLDRLMLAESGGRDDARNPRSTALGPYQFIEATFINVARRYFTKEVEKLDDAKLLAFRTNRAFARRVAEAYTRDNAAYLAAAGLKPTFPNLRLAFLLGAGGAIQVLRAKPQTRLIALLSPGVIRANPFMARLTAKGLIARAARDIETTPTNTASVAPGTVPPSRRSRRARPSIRVRCNLARPSCRRWLALQKSKRKKRPGRRTRVSRR
ncbi:MAG: hypothetical protein KDJ36_10255 [Hyphomicrobiaceae bacterium]|nr:hypothetical protein [Hyphomicrobiaceae bacterium]